MKRFRDTTTISVPLPPAEAMALFTARGERRWVEGWDPTFPAGEPADEDEGTVWVTHAHGRRTYWVVAARASRSVRYARVTPDFSAGTVEVRERSSTADTTEVDVTYDLTALGPHGEAELERFSSRYAEEIGAWEAAVEAMLDGSDATRS